MQAYTIIDKKEAIRTLQDDIDSYLRKGGKITVIENPVIEFKMLNPVRVNERAARLQGMFYLSED